VTEAISRERPYGTDAALAGGNRNLDSTARVQRQIKKFRPDTEVGAKGDVQPSSRGGNCASPVVFLAVIKIVILIGRPPYANRIIRQPLEYIEFQTSRKEGISKKIAVLYGEGLSLRQVSDETGVAKSSVRETLIGDGVELRPHPKVAVGRNFASKPTRVGIPPYGFAWLRGRMVVDPREIETVRLIIHSWQAGCTVTAIAHKLIRLRKKTRNGGIWDHSLVRKIIVRYQHNPRSIEEVFTWESKNSSN